MIVKQVVEVFGVDEEVRPSFEALQNIIIRVIALELKNEIKKKSFHNDYGSDFKYNMIYNANYVVSIYVLKHIQLNSLFNYNYVISSFMLRIGLCGKLSKYVIKSIFINNTKMIKLRILDEYNRYLNRFEDSYVCLRGYKIIFMIKHDINLFSKNYLGTTCIMNNNKHYSDVTDKIDIFIAIMQSLI